MERYLNLSLPFGLVPTEATIGSYRQKPSARALRLVATNYRPTGIKPVVANRMRENHEYESHAGAQSFEVSKSTTSALSRLTIRFAVVAGLALAMVAGLARVRFCVAALKSGDSSYPKI
jgi:hypothetical protein